MKGGADGKRTTAPVTVGNPGGYIPSGAMVEALLTFVVLSDGNGSGWSIAIRQTEKQWRSLSAAHTGLTEPS